MYVGAYLTDPLNSTSELSSKSASSFNNLIFDIQVTFAIFFSSILSMDLQNLFLKITMLSFLHADVTIQTNVGPIKSRPSYRAVFYVSNSTLGSATTVLPAVDIILFSNLTRNYILRIYKTLSIFLRRPKVWS